MPSVSSLFPAFTSADQIRWALESAATVCGLTQKRLARALGVHEVVMSYWLAGARYPAPEVWHRLIAVVAKWLTLTPVSSAAAQRLASAVVTGPFWLATPVTWGAVLGVEESVFAASPTDGRGFLTGFAAGEALLTALRARLPVPPDHPEYARVRDWLAVDQLHRQLVGQLTLAHDAAAMLQQIERGLGELQKKHPKVVAQAMADAKAGLAKSSRRRGRGK